MNHPKNFHNLLFVVNDLSHTILKKIDDYDKRIEKDNNIISAFYNIQFVYIHSIVLDIAKLISATGADKSGLKQLKEICPDKDIKVKIEAFEQKYKYILAKIIVNRNKIIAHVDISDMGSYVNMGFSKIEIERKITDYKDYLKITGGELDATALNLISQLKKLESVSIDKERYSPSDFSIEIPTLKEMVNEILVVASDLNLYFYKLQK
jgi:hypothetical protein